MNTSQKHGKFITIEGQDGAGKTTNIEFICRFLQRQGIDFLVTREPGGTVLGEQIRELLLEKEISINAKTELLLMFSARAQHVDEVIMPALKEGKWVVCDRFTDASYAYQGGGHGIDQRMIQDIETVCIGAFKPDLTLLLDIDVHAGQQRTEQRASHQDKKDRFERQKLEFKQRVRDTYLQRQQQDSQRMKLINAEQPLETVQNDINRQLLDFLNDR